MIFCILCIVTIFLSNCDTVILPFFLYFGTIFLSSPQVLSRLSISLWLICVVYLLMVVILCCRVLWEYCLCKMICYFSLIMLLFQCIMCFSIHFPVPALFLFHLYVWYQRKCYIQLLHCLHFHSILYFFIRYNWSVYALTKICHHHHVPEGLGVFPVPWSSRWSWSLHLFLGRPMFLRPFGLYCSACFGRLCQSSVHVVATFSGTLLFPLLCSVLPFFA